MRTSVKNMTKEQKRDYVNNACKKWYYSEKGYRLRASLDFKKRRSLREKKYRLKRIEKIKDFARSSVHSAVYAGRIKKEICKRCGCPDSEAHHKDYKKPLKVIWLCRECHIKEHYYTP